MNALFLKDLVAKNHRGLRGRIEQGRSGGGLCYGYDVVKRTDREGEPVRGDRTINEGQAEIVRRIFREFAAGISPRAIARRLNDEGIPGPAGALWTDSTQRGHAKRRHGAHQQRAIHRQAGLEPAALPQGPLDRQASVADQPAGGLDHDGGPRAAH